MSKISNKFSFPAFLIIGFFSLILVSFNDPAETKVYQPSADFKYLKEPWVLSRCVTMAHWETNNDFTFDSVGVIRNKKTYHPVVISQYALTCYDAYMKTKDDNIKVKFLNQAKYLINPKSYTGINEEVVGYPYTVNFHDLTAPWYSGLAQAEVLGVLIRYYSLTKDTSILPLMVKIKNMMVLPVSQRGLLDTTSDGHLWIEEYPNSKQHKHVLNGFMVTILLLDDYCKFFPADTATRSIVNQCFESIKRCAGFYDTGSWLKYDRGSSAQNVSNWYMKAQVIEADQLYRVTNDDYFKKLSMLWSTYCYNKFIGLKGCIIDSINYNVPLEVTDGGLMPTKHFTNVLAKSALKNFSVNRSDTLQGISLLMDNNDNTKLKIVRDKYQAEPAIIQMDFNEPLSFQQVAMVSVKSLENKIEFTVRYSSKDDWKKIAIIKSLYYKSNNLFNFDAKNVYAMRITFPGFNDEPVEIGEIKINKWAEDEPSEYGYYQTGIMKTSNDSLNFSFLKNKLQNFCLFYKTSGDSATLKKQKYSADSAVVDSFPELYGKAQLASVLLVVDRNVSSSKKNKTANSK